VFSYSSYVPNLTILCVQVLFRYAAIYVNCVFSSFLASVVLLLDWLWPPVQCGGGLGWPQASTTSLAPAVPQPQWCDVWPRLQFYGELLGSSPCSLLLKPMTYGLGLVVVVRLGFGHDTERAGISHLL
jgi:hypothetical protein